MKIEDTITQHWVPLQFRQFAQRLTQQLDVERRQIHTQSAKFDFANYPMLYVCHLVVAPGWRMSIKTLNGDYNLQTYTKRAQCYYCEYKYGVFVEDGGDLSDMPSVDQWLKKTPVIDYCKENAYEVRQWIRQ